AFGIDANPCRVAWPKCYRACPGINDKANGSPVYLGLQVVLAIGADGDLDTVALQHPRLRRDGVADIGPQPGNRYHPQKNQSPCHGLPGGLSGAAAQFGHQIAADHDEQQRQIGKTSEIITHYTSPDPLRPSITNWIDKAASNMPKSRVTTMVPVRPSTLPIGPAIEKRIAAMPRTASMTRWIISVWAGLGFCPTSSTMLASAPGPASSGVARGKTEGSSSSSRA